MKPSSFMIAININILTHIAQYTMRFDDAILLDETN